MFRKLLRKYYHRTKIEEAKRRYSFLQMFDPSKLIIQKLTRKDSYSIAFLLPGLPAFSGGITGLFRLGTYLEEFGNKVTYLDCSNSNPDEIEKNARINHVNYKGQIKSLKNLGENYDIGICTLWDTAYFLHEFSANFDYKVYFIQDFEPFFYPKGDLHSLSMKTYDFGFHAITLGGWNAGKIREIFPNIKVDSIEFPVELNVYGIQKRIISIKDQLNIAIFIKLEPKRAPDLIIQCLIYLKSVLDRKGIQLNCEIFGTEISFGLPFVKSRGMLEHKDLQTLYRRNHIGLVASFTNISYVTFEMMASGLPVIEFRDGSSSFFFKEDEIILIDSNPQDFSSKICYYLERQSDLNRLLEKSQNAIERRTWEISSQTFQKIILQNAN
jgi:O-antigen biosynthesis protein